MFARRLQAASHGTPIVTPFAINQTSGGLVDLKITTITGTPVLIDWGDGIVTTASSGASVSHTYGSTYTGNVTVQSAGALTRWESANGKWSFDLSSLPSMMTYFYCSGSNTISGNLSSLPSMMTYFYCPGSNTISGNLSSLPAVMTNFTCTGSNTISGNLSSLPAVMTNFICAGSSTVTGNLSSLPAVMTNFYCTGSNTITGNLSSLPAVMTNFTCDGPNTISDYTGKTWANNQARVYLIPVAPGGLSSLEVDQLLIDLAAAGGTWAAPKQVYLKGTNAARTAASNAAVATLQGKGVTVTTN